MFRGLLGGSGERYISGNVERLLGYTQEQVLGSSSFWTDQLHPEDRERFTAMLERAVVEQAPQLEQEYRFLLQDGYRWLYGVTRLVYDDDGALADTLGYAMDVTERKQADDAVREREATLQAVINASPDIITILDAEGAIRSMSPAAQQILGRQAETRMAAAPSTRSTSIPTTWSGSRTPSVSCSAGSARAPRSVSGSATPRGTGSPSRRTAGSWPRPRASWSCPATSPSRPSWRRTCAWPSSPPSRPTRPRASTCRA